MNITSMYRRPFVYSLGQILGNFAWDRYWVGPRTSTFNFRAIRKALNDPLDFRSTKTIQGSISESRARLESLKREERKAEKPQIAPLPVLQKTYRAEKKDFDPVVDAKPVFSSSYSARPPMVNKSGGLRGGAARGGKNGRW